MRGAKQSDFSPRAHCGGRVLGLRRVHGSAPNRKRQGRAPFPAGDALWPGPSGKPLRALARRGGRGVECAAIAASSLGSSDRAGGHPASPSLSHRCGGRADRLAQLVGTSTLPWTVRRHIAISPKSVRRCSMLRRDPRTAGEDGPPEPSSQASRYWRPFDRDVTCPMSRERS